MLTYEEARAVIDTMRFSGASDLLPNSPKKTKQVRASNIASDLRFFGRGEILASEILQKVITTNMQVKHGVYIPEA